MGMGRNSSRIASRRLATSSKESGNYREDLDEGKTYLLIMIYGSYNSNCKLCHLENSLNIFLHIMKVVIMPKMKTGLNLEAEVIMGALLPRLVEKGIRILPEEIGILNTCDYTDTLLVAHSVNSFMCSNFMIIHNTGLAKLPVRYLPHQIRQETGIIIVTLGNYKEVYMY